MPFALLVIVFSSYLFNFRSSAHRTHHIASDTIIITIRSGFEGTIEHEPNQWLSSIFSPNTVSCSESKSNTCVCVWMRSCVRLTPSVDDICCITLFSISHTNAYRAAFISHPARRKQPNPLISIDSTQHLHASHCLLFAWNARDFIAFSCF